MRTGVVRQVKIIVNNKENMRTPVTSLRILNSSQGKTLSKERAISRDPNLGKQLGSYPLVNTKPEATKLASKDNLPPKPYTYSRASSRINQSIKQINKDLDGNKLGHFQHKTEQLSKYEQMSLKDSQRKNTALNQAQQSGQTTSKEQLKGNMTRTTYSIERRNFKDKLNHQLNSIREGAPALTRISSSTQNKLTPKGQNDEIKNSFKVDHNNVAENLVAAYRHRISEIDASNSKKDLEKKFTSFHQPQQSGRDSVNRSQNYEMEQHKLDLKLGSNITFDAQWLTPRLSGLNPLQERNNKFEHVHKEENDTLKKNISEIRNEINTFNTHIGSITKDKYETPSSQKSLQGEVSKKESQGSRSYLKSSEEVDEKKCEKPSYITNAISSQPLGEPKGLVGLRNIGNTCFMNSILQCLFNAPLFTDYFLRDSHKKEKNAKAKGLADAFGALLAKVRSHSGRPSSAAESTYDVKSRIAKVNPIFSGYDQHDAQELLKALLEGINDDLNRVVTKPPYKELTANTNRNLQEISDEWFEYMLQRDNSIVTDLFCGQLLSRTRCTHCNHESLAFDNYWDLALSFVKGASDGANLYKMMEQFLKEEDLDDLFYCEKCKARRKSKKKFSIWKLPKILVVQLKRFEYSQYRREKINKSVTFPVSCFDLKQFTNTSTDASVQDCKYTLFGIVNHGGSLSGGHYTAECMNPYNRKWYNFNDSHVRETSMNKEESESSSPYILFYVKSSCLSN